MAFLNMDDPPFLNFNLASSPVAMVLENLTCSFWFSRRGRVWLVPVGITSTSFKPLWVALHSTAFSGHSGTCRRIRRLVL